MNVEYIKIVDTHKYIVQANTKYTSYFFMFSSSKYYREFIIKSDLGVLKIKYKSVN